MSGITAIIGKSGVGKTSLLNLLVGFESAADAQIEFSERDPSKPVGLSWVPADFGLWPHLNVEEHLLTVAADDEQSVGKLIEQFDLEACLSQRPATLSMGERARLAVARSLATKAEVHVMDEPFTHVDPARVDRYWDHLREQLEALNSSLIFATHSPNIVLREADHLICLESGRVAWSGAPQKLYYSPPTRELGALLGPLNWFDKAQTLRILGDGEQQSFRPEQFELVEAVGTASQHALEVLKSSHVGSHQETIVSSNSEDQVRTIYHRTASTKLAPGMLVTLRMITNCLLLWVLLLFSGCRESAGNEATISVSDVNQFLLPAEGAMLPAARGMTHSPDGDLYILDNVGRALRYDSEGKLIHKWWMPDYDIGRPEEYAF